ncbi:putative porin [Paraburkholderia sp. UCT70]|uniref:porin n=1 Tax=Paraburkholderia sp. UCT70 TaxID=2991068 RepID=UPI003D243CE7
MKRIALSTLSLALLGVSGMAHAQSSVTLYGLIDESIQYVNNATPHGGSLVQLFGGNLQAPRFGLKGTEDLGGGLKAIFQLENGFDVNTGKLGQGGLMFGRQAYVGLTGDSWGTVTAGRQYDPLVDMVQPLTADNYFGSTFTTPGDVDNNDNSFRVNNSVKYVSPVWSGFQFEGLYGLGGVAGATGSGQTYAGAATFATGPISVAAGYVRTKNASSPTLRSGWNSTTTTGTFNTNFPTFAGINSAYATASSIGIASVAVQYVTGPWTGNLSYSNAQYYRDGASTFGQTQKYEVGRAYLGYQLTPAALVGVGYAYTKGHGDASATYNQVSLGGDYSLSKRTDLYAVGAWQHASGEQRVPGVGGGLVSSTASIGSYGNQSSTNNQVMVSLGIRHKF